MRCLNLVCREVFEVRPSSEMENDAAADQPGEAPPKLDENDTPPRSRAGQAGIGKSSAENLSVAGSVGDMVPLLPAESIEEEEPDDHEVPGEDAAPPASDEDDVISLLPAEMADVPPSNQRREVTSWEEPPPVRNPNAPPAPARPLDQAAKTSPTKPKIGQEPHFPVIPQKRPGPVGEPTNVQSPEEQVGESAGTPSGAEWSPPPVRRTPNIGAGAALPEHSWPSQETSLPRPDYEIAESELLAPPPARKRARWIMIGILGFAAGILGGAIWIAYGLVTENEEFRFSQAMREYEQGKYVAAKDTFGKLAQAFPDSERLSIYQFLAGLSAVRDEASNIQSDPADTLHHLRDFLQNTGSSPHLKEHQSDLWHTFHRIVTNLTEKAAKTNDPDLLSAAEEALREAKKYNTGDEAGNRQISEMETRFGAIREEIARGRRRQSFLVQLQNLVEKPLRDPFRAAKRLIAEAVEKDPALAKDSDVQSLMAHLDAAVRDQVSWIPRTTVPAATVQDTEPLILVAPIVHPPSAASIKPGVVFGLVRGILYALNQQTSDVLWALQVGVDSVNLPVRLTDDSVLVIGADTQTAAARNIRTGKLLWQCGLGAPCLGKPLLVAGRAYLPTYDGKIHEIDLRDGNLLGRFELGQSFTVGGVAQNGGKLLYFPADDDTVYALDPANKKRPCVGLLHAGHPAGSIRCEPAIHSRHELRKAFDLSEANWPDLLILNSTEGLRDTRLRVLALPIKNSHPQPPSLMELGLPGWSWFPPSLDAEKLAQVTDAGMIGIYGFNQLHDQDPPIFVEIQSKVPSNSPQGGPAQVVHVDDQDLWVLAQGQLQRYHFDRYAQKLVPMWSHPAELGSPVQPAQADEDGKILVMVAQPSGGDRCLATAVDSNDGKILWQRQLGMTWQGEPFVLKDEILAVQQGGGLFLFDPKKGNSGGPSPILGQRLAMDLGGAVEQLYLLPGEDGASALEIACAAGSSNLTVRHYQPDKGAPVPATQTFHLTAPLAGTPALHGGNLFMPLANGNLRRQPLDGGQGADVQTWRSRRADEGAHGHVLHVGEDVFVLTDGSRGLTACHWPVTDEYRLLKTIELSGRITAAPISLPRTAGKDDFQIVAADRDGDLVLLQGKELKQARHWPLGGRITQGPFLLGKHIGVVIDRNELVWVDPAGEKIWRYAANKESIVGQPRLVAGRVLIAHVDGRIVGLDLATGRPKGAAYRLRSRASPATSPVGFGPDKVIVPLTDGTLVLLPIGKLH